jgi:hypothetical protein
MPNFKLTIRFPTDSEGPSTELRFTVMDAFFLEEPSEWPCVSDLFKDVASEKRTSLEFQTRLKVEAQLDLIEILADLGLSRDVIALCRFESPKPFEFIAILPDGLRDPEGLQDLLNDLTESLACSFMGEARIDLIEPAQDAEPLEPLTEQTLTWGAFNLDEAFPGVGDLRVELHAFDFSGLALRRAVSSVSRAGLNRKLRMLEPEIRCWPGERRDAALDLLKDTLASALSAWHKIGSPATVWIEDRSGDFSSPSLLVAWSVPNGIVTDQRGLDAALQATLQALGNADSTTSAPV